ncbi:zf-HC2 domain-containing protein [Duganella aquatilis]|uniref:zf-HC2 domain-containing protein n=1 Tax=Duganella aquatilis TaxID=2666082 RepID=UPI003530EE78
MFRLDIPVHQAVQELLPWYASAQLSADETRRVHDHLQSCAQCRHALEWEHGMRAEAAASASADSLPDGVDMEGALARLLPALGPQERTAATMAGNGFAPAVATSAAATDAAAASGPATAVPHPQRVSWWRAAAANQPSWLRWAVAAQWVAIVGLGALLLRPDAEPAAYRTLGAGAAAMGNLVVVFQPSTSEHELRRILQAQNARVVDGPTVTDAYLLNVPAASRAQALQALRAESAVKLVEPLDGGSAP